MIHFSALDFEHCWPEKDVTDARGNGAEDRGPSRGHHHHHVANIEKNNEKEEEVNGEEKKKEWKEYFVDRYLI